MHSFFHYAAAVILMSATLSCDNLEYHPYGADIDGAVSLNTTYISQITERTDGLPIKFAFLSDTQGCYDDLRDAVKIIAVMSDIDFVVHGGDLTDFGLPKEFIWCRDLMERLGKPYFAVIGNHDCLGNGEQTFRYMFGEKNFSFNVAGVHFLCLNTNALEYDYSEPVPDFEFISSDAEAVAALNVSQPESVTHTVIVMHSRPGDEQFNNNVAKPFMHYLTLFPGLGPDDDVFGDEAGTTFAGTRRRGFCINGHNHNNAVHNYDNQGILFHQCANIGKRSFMIVTIDSESYETEYVNF